MGQKKPILCCWDPPRGRCPPKYLCPLLLTYFKAISGLEIFVFPLEIDFFKKIKEQISKNVPLFIIFGACVAEKCKFLVLLALKMFHFSNLVTLRFGGSFTLFKPCIVYSRDVVGGPLPKGGA